MKDAAKHSVTSFTYTAINDKNMASSTNTTKPHGKLLMFLSLACYQGSRFFAICKILHSSWVM